MRSIYDNPYKYAVVCNIPFWLAKIACKKQRHLLKEVNKHRMYCPTCGSRHLGFEGGSYEEGYSDYIYCEDCGSQFDVVEVPNSAYASLTGWEDFDPVLYFGCRENKTQGWKEACGGETYEEWLLFAKNIILGYEHVEVNV